MSDMPGAPGTGKPRFSLLGAFGAELDGKAAPLGPRLQRTLLAILVVEAGHVVPVDRLIDLLWHEEPPAAAIASLQAYVSQLRRLLEPGRAARALSSVLVTQDPGYVLRATEDQIDALCFQALARQAHLDLLGGDPAAAAAGVEAAAAASAWSRRWSSGCSRSPRRTPGCCGTRSSAGRRCCTPGAN